MKKLLATALILALAFTFAACGEKKAATVTDNAETTATDTAAETGAPSAEAVAVGNKIVTDFVEMNITEAGMASSMKTSIKQGNITRTFGPDDSSETEFAYIKGTITNKATSALQNEITAIAKVGDYTLEEDGFYVYKSDGDTVYELSPLVEYNFMMYVEIPNVLVESMESCDFNFGFAENMDTSFSSFDEYAYKYSLKITPAAEEVPAPEKSTVE